MLKIYVEDIKRFDREYRFFDFTLFANKVNANVHKS